MSEIKKSKKGDIVKVVLAVLTILLGTYIFVDPNKPDYKFDEAAISKIDSLQKINDTLRIRNIELDSLLDDYSLRIYDLDYKLSELISQRSNTNDYYKKKREEIVDDTPSDLDTFFMNRYEYIKSSEE